jgi:serine O-acetyltransferase
MMIGTIRRILSCMKAGRDIRLAFCDIPFDTVPPSTLFPHAVGIVIARSAILGENCTIRPNVVIGVRNGKYPVIGNGVDIGAGSLVLGGITVGDHATIGAGAVVLEDVPPGAVYITQYKGAIK